MSGALALAAAVLLAQRPMPPQPQSPTRYYQPDQQVCNPERLLAGYRQGLSAYADQPPAVLEQLSGLQRQLTARSLKVCLEKGLLKADQAERLIETMGLALPALAPLPADSPVQAAPKTAPLQPAPLQPAASRPAAPNQTIFKPAPIKPAPIKPAPLKPAPLKPAAVKPAIVTPRSGPSATPKSSGFDMSPIESNPDRSAPIEPKAQ
ncbi:MAG: hypothetical protein WBM08_05110 [Prochlorococcaceae cyanobacterium]